MKILSNTLIPHLNKEGYKIVKNNIVLDTVTMDEFIDKIRSGKITYDYGRQIIIPYTDPYNNVEYELPFSYGTTQEFEKEDGTIFTGLGLCATYAIPSKTVQFDNAEPSNPNSNRKSDGNNRWSVSNLRQWMNKSGLNWYEPQHEYDTESSSPNQANTVGLLSCFPQDFIEAISTVKISTFTSDFDGNVVDVTFDKFFLLSMNQANLKCTSYRSCSNDETEGHYWEYWREKSGKNDYLTSSSSETGNLMHMDYRIIYNINNTQKAYWRLRSCNYRYTYALWGVLDDGRVSSGTNFNAKVSDRIAPACVIG